MIKKMLVFLVIFLGVEGSLALANRSVDDLPDLTGGVVPVIDYKGHDPFSGNHLTSVSDVEYTVRIENRTGDPLVADSLILVIDRLQEISGKEISDRVEIEGSDGVTKEGKPFFRIPSSNQELAPYGESEVVTIRITNPDYLRFFPPKIRVRGLRRPASDRASSFLESLVNKGLISPKEAVEALDSSSSANP